MNITEQLFVENSRRNTEFIAAYIGNDTGLFSELMEQVFKGYPPLPLRASWVVCVVTDRFPALLNPYLTIFIDNLMSFEHTGIHRNVIRQLAKSDIPETHLGILFDHCYTWLLARNEPPAVKVHCMQVLFNIAKKEPDLQQELRLIFEELTTHESAAIRSRSSHLLTKLMQIGYYQRLYLC